jgi:hypothetical protein
MSNSADESIHPTAYLEEHTASTASVLMVEAMTHNKKSTSLADVEGGATN